MTAYGEHLMAVVTEAILKLRALRTNGHFNEYWSFHLNNERHRVHETRYTAAIIPAAA